MIVVKILYYIIQLLKLCGNNAWNIRSLKSHALSEFHRARHVSVIFQIFATIKLYNHFLSFFYLGFFSALMILFPALMKYQNNPNISDSLSLSFSYVFGGLSSWQSPDYRGKRGVGFGSSKLPSEVEYDSRHYPRRWTHHLCSSTL